MRNRLATADSPGVNAEFCDVEAERMRRSVCYAIDICKSVKDEVWKTTSKTTYPEDHEVAVVGSFLLMGQSPEQVYVPLIARDQDPSKTNG